MSDIKQEYAASSTLTITLDALASSATHVLGRESTAVDNTSLKYLDYLLAGKIITHASVSPTVNTEIRIYVVGLMDDTTYPDVMDGTNSDETWVNINIRDAASKLAAVIVVTATANITYFFGPVSVRALFGGNIPKKFAVWVSQNTGQALHATGPHVIWITPTYETVV